MPLFSVIVPVFNIEQYLRKCLDSILKQSFTNFEVILVDDGSQDNSVTICNEYARIDNRISVIHESNLGPVGARQKGFEEAKGQYIIAIDGDDFVDSQYLEKFAKIIEETNAEIVCCGYVEYYSPNKIINIPLTDRKGFYNRSDIIKEIFPILIENERGIYFKPMIWAKAIKASLCKRYQIGKVVINFGEDHAFTKPYIYHANSLYIMEECLYFYRKNNVASITKVSAHSWDAPEMIGRHFEKYIDVDKYDFRDQINRFVVHMVFNVAVSRYRIGNCKEVSREIKKNLDNNYYSECIKNCKYKGNFRGNLAKLALRYKITFLIFLYFKSKKY